MSEYFRGKYDGYLECLAFILCGCENEELKNLIRERMGEINEYRESNR